MVLAFPRYLVVRSFLRFALICAPLVGVFVGVDVGAQILNPADCPETSEWKAKVVTPDAARKAGNAVESEMLPQYFVLPFTWR